MTAPPTSTTTVVSPRETTDPMPGADRETAMMNAAEQRAEFNKLMKPNDQTVGIIGNMYRLGLRDNALINEWLSKIEPERANTIKGLLKSAGISSATDYDALVEKAVKYYKQGYDNELNNSEMEILRTLSMVVKEAYLYYGPNINLTGRSANLSEDKKSKQKIESYNVVDRSASLNLEEEALNSAETPGEEVTTSEEASATAKATAKTTDASAQAPNNAPDTDEGLVPGGGTVFKALDLAPLSPETTAEIQKLQERLSLYNGTETDDFAKSVLTDIQAEIGELPKYIDNKEAFKVRYRGIADLLNMAGNTLNYAHKLDRNNTSGIRERLELFKDVVVAPHGLRKEVTRDDATTAGNIARQMAADNKAQTYQTQAEFIPLIERSKAISQITKYNADEIRHYQRMVLLNRRMYSGFERDVRRQNEYELKGYQNVGREVRRHPVTRKNTTFGWFGAGFGIFGAMKDALNRPNVRKDAKDLYHKELGLVSKEQQQRFEAVKTAIDSGYNFVYTSNPEEAGIWQDPKTGRKEIRVLEDGSNE